MGYVLCCVSVLKRIDLDGFVSFLVLVIVVQGVSLLVKLYKLIFFVQGSEGFSSKIDFLGS